VRIKKHHERKDIIVVGRTTLIYLTIYLGFPVGKNHRRGVF